MMFLTLLAIVHYDSLVKRVDAQFQSLQEDHREIRGLMIRNTAKFTGIIEDNTEAVKETGESVRKAHGQARKAQPKTEN